MAKPPTQDSTMGFQLSFSRLAVSGPGYWVGSLQDCTKESKALRDQIKETRLTDSGPLEFGGWWPLRVFINP